VNTRRVWSERHPWRHERPHRPGTTASFANVSRYHTTVLSLTPGGGHLAAPLNGPGRGISAGGWFHAATWTRVVGAMLATRLPAEWWLSVMIRLIHRDIIGMS